MEVKAINSLQYFGNRYDNHTPKKPDKNRNTYPQIDAPASKTFSKASKDLLMGLMILGAAANTSCDKKLFEAYSESGSAAGSFAYAIGPENAKTIHDTTEVVVHDTINNIINHTDTINNTDTIIKIVTEFKPVYVRHYPWHIADSLIRQGDNVGVEIIGPMPKEIENHVAFIGAIAHNQYDNIFHELHVDSIGTNDEQLTLITKNLDLYNKNNPKTTWMKSNVIDIPGEGIKLERYIISDPDEVQPKASDHRWRYAGYEIRTNNRDRKTNSVKIYDRDDNFVGERKGQYVRGQELGSFMFGTVVYNDDGSVYINEDTGKPEYTYYDFDKAKIYTAEVEEPLYYGQ